MILIEKEHYYRVAGLLTEVAFNHLFAQAVLEKKIKGVVFVDNYEVPTSFYIVHPYGMSLLSGNCENEEFNKQLVDYLLNIGQTRKRIEWMQVYPTGWSTQLSGLLGNQLLTKEQQNSGVLPDVSSVHVEEQTRVNFKFNLNKYSEFRATLAELNGELRRTGEDEYHNMQGTVVPKFFWQSASQFLEEGIGFSLYVKGELACTSFSSFINEYQLELGIETVPCFRGKGYAIYTCAALIDYCLENGYEPIWSCRLENTGSYLLAQKLCFEPVHFHPFYKVNI